MNVEFIGITEKKNFYLILDAVDRLKQDGYQFVRRIRNEKNGIVDYDYKLIKP